jgi:hypothetical protein
MLCLGKTPGQDGLAALLFLVCTETLLRTVANARIRRETSAGSRKGIDCRDAVPTFGSSVGRPSLGRGWVSFLARVDAAAVGGMTAGHVDLA